MVGFCGSRSLPASAEVSALVSGVVGSVLAGVPRRGVAVGCAVGGDALVVSSALALGASSRLRVFAAFGPVSPPWPAARVSAPGASSSVSSVSGVASRPRRRRLRLLVGRGRSLGPPGRSPRLPLLGPRLGGRRLRRGPRLRRVRLLALPGRARSLSFALGLLLRLRLRVVGLPRARLGLGTPRRRLPRAASGYGPRSRPARLLAGLVGLPLRRVVRRLPLRSRPASARRPSSPDAEDLPAKPQKRGLGNRLSAGIFTVRAQVRKTCKWPGGAGTAPGPAQGGKP